MMFGVFFDCELDNVSVTDMSKLEKDKSDISKRLVFAYLLNSRGSNCPVTSIVWLSLQLLTFFKDPSSL